MLPISYWYRDMTSVSRDGILVARTVLCATTILLTTGWPIAGTATAHTSDVGIW